MLDAYGIADIELYLKDEGLDDSQISEFISSHDLQSLSYDAAWEIVDNHLIRDDYDDDLD